MSKTTPNYKFIKPELNDPANIETTNPNWDTLDTELKSKASISDIDGKLADKADKTYVDDALKKKADTSTVDAKNNLQDEAIEQNKSGLSSHIGNSLNPHKVTAEQVKAIPTSKIGAENGVCPLDENGQIPEQYGGGKLTLTEVITLQSDSWLSNTQIVQNPIFKTGEQYVYTVSPFPADIKPYSIAGIAATAVDDSGMTFICLEKPTKPIRVNISMVEAKV